MKSLVATMSVIFALLIVPFVAFAQSASPAPAIQAPADPNAVVGMIPTIMNFVHNGQYLALGGAITLIVCFLMNQYVLPKIGLGSAAVPLISSAVGVLSGVGLAVANGGSPLAAALAVMSGPAATHLWELGIQYFFAKPAAPVAAAAAQPPVQKTS